MVTIQIISFISLADVASQKLMMMSVYVLIMLLFHLLGITLYKVVNWKISTYLTIWFATASSVLVIIAVLAMRSTKELTKIIDTQVFNYFNDYSSGVIVILIFMGLSLYLYASSKKEALKKIKVV
ncbi:hypothetical protein ACT3TH_02870 [Psychrobacter sp. AOP22-C1-C5]|uniref:hypothetical protein n=1 Tax=Psychrobacter sp. AOP22-C1-C5 TaxID=3457716 RepID=UPI004036BBE5